MATEFASALFVLGVACFTLCVTIFHYFKEKVDKHTIEGTKLLLFASSSRKEFRDMLRGVAQASYVYSFVEEVSRITEARRRFRSLLLFLPLDGVLFFVSGFFTIVVDTNNDVIKPFVSAISFSTYMAITGGIILLVYTGYLLARLLRKLA